MPTETINKEKLQCKLQAAMDYAKLVWITAIVSYPTAMVVDCACTELDFREPFHNDF